MATFKLDISHKGKSYTVEKDQSVAVGKKIGDIIKGEAIGLEGYELKITGGSDKDGFPMRKDMEGSVKKKIILIKSVGFSGVKKIKKKKYKRSGLRKRKTVRGNTINAEIKQINLSVTKAGEKALDEIFPKKEKSENKG